MSSAGEEGAVTVRVPAKVNLQLAVGPRRPDGFHEVASVFHAVSVYDDVVAVPSSDLTVEVSGVGAGAVPVDGNNLAVRAARRLAAQAGRDPQVHLRLRKQIPVAAGMAGGSADAAGALLACDALWGTRLDRATLLRLAAELGSDVPFGLVGGTAVGLGRGEQLTPAMARGELHWVFAVDDEGLATPAVYAETDRLRAGRAVPAPRPSSRLLSALLAGDAAAVGRAMANDLQAAACNLRPRLRLTLELGLDYGALGAVVSGSGPTCAFLARDAEHALDLAVALTASGTCRTVKRATGPVPGARRLAERADG